MNTLSYASTQIDVRLAILADGIYTNNVEWEWWIDEEGTASVVDLALPVGDGWLSVTFGIGPAGGLRFEEETEPEACLRETQARLRIS